MAYKSVAYANGTNFLFFERGFKKLAIREVQLYLGERKSKNSTSIICADTCDYMPNLEEYGKYFVPLAKQGFDEHYLNTNEYKIRKNNHDD